MQSNMLFLFPFRAINITNENCQLEMFPFERNQFE